MTLLEGFESIDEQLLILTHPVTGYYFKRNNNIGTYNIWHPKMELFNGEPIDIYFELFEKLGLLSKEEMKNPHSVLMTPAIDFDILLPILLLALAFTSCKNCKNEDPISRIVNNGTESVSVHIATSGGNTVNINNIQPGTTSEDKTFAQGTVSFTISIGNNADVVETVVMEDCWEYEIVIDANNNVTSLPTDRNE